MQKRDTLTLFAFIDAFGWEVLQRHNFLDDVLVTKRPLNTIFGYSSTCIPTILTGRVPRDHGHFSFFFHSPETSPFAICRYLKYLPKSVTGRGRVRRMMSKFIQRYYGYTGYFQIYNMPFDHLPLFDYSEKKDMYVPDGINNPEIGTIFDFLDENEIPFHVSNWRNPEAQNFEELKQDIRKAEIDFGYLYSAELDGLLHLHGTESQIIDDKIAWYDEQLRDVLSIAEKQYKEVRLFVFSDHGQADIKELCPLIEPIEALGYRFGVDYAAVYDSTMARFWFLKDGVRERVEEVLKQEPRGRILSDDTLTEWGCNFAGDKYGELFFLLDPGVLLCPSFLGQTPLAGMHGYAPDDKDSIAMFSSNVEVENPPDRLDDMYRVMSAEALREKTVSEMSQ